MNEPLDDYIVFPSGHFDVNLATHGCGDAPKMGQEVARKDPEVTNVGREVPSRSYFSANLAQHGRWDAPQIAKERTQALPEAAQGCLIAPNRQLWELRDDFEGYFSGQMATTWLPQRTIVCVFWLLV